MPMIMFVLSLQTETADGPSAPPERLGGPPSLDAIDIQQRCPVAVKLPIHHRFIPPQSFVVAAQDPIRDRVGCEHSRSESVDDTLPANRIDGESSIPDADQG